MLYMWNANAFFSCRIVDINEIFTLLWSTDMWKCIPIYNLKCLFKFDAEDYHWEKILIPHQQYFLVYVLNIVKDIFYFLV